MIHYNLMTKKDCRGLGHVLSRSHRYRTISHYVCIPIRGLLQETETSDANSKFSSSDKATN